MSGTWEWYRALPPMSITLAELKELRDYSRSYPTGTTLGKTWRTHVDGVVWIIRRYEEAPARIKGGIVQEMCKVAQYRPVIRVAMGRHAYSARPLVE